MKHIRRLVVFATLSVIVVSLLAWALPKFLNPNPPTKAEKQRDRAWVASSPYWLDRQTCRFFSLCGLHHIHRDFPSIKEKKNYVEFLHESQLELRSLDWSAHTNTLQRREDDRRRRRKGVPDDSTQADKSLRPIPQYVIDHAPLVHLYTGENFWPSDIAEHVRHMVPVGEGGKPINMSEPLSLRNLDQLNNIPLERMIFLTSLDDVENRPNWLHSKFNIPNEFSEDVPGDEGKHDSFTMDPAADEWSWFDVDFDHPLHGISDPRRLHDIDQHRDTGAISHQGSRRIQGRSEQKPMSPPVPPTAMHKPDGSGFSEAPAILLLVEKGPHILDAFWFFFYSYNLGQTVGGIRFGNHVGDWEHCMVRFEDGIPRAVFMSEHAGGQAYAWDALEKRKIEVAEPGGEKREVERFVIYSAVGSHAMYANPGDHPYILPFNMLKDQTDRGPIWDPSLNTYSYHFDYRAGLNNSFGSELEDCEYLDESLVKIEERIRSNLRKVNNETIHGIFGDRGIQPTSENPNIATNWFHFLGPWGDETYGLNDTRQYRLFGQYHYLTGPLGPKVKYLERHKVCQTEKCVVLHRIKKGATWY